MHEQDNTRDHRLSDSNDASEAASQASLPRREWIKKCLPAAAMLSAPAWLPQVTYARTAPPRDVLVHIFLRGGMDGLTTCVPHGDIDYYNSRPRLAIPRPGQPNGAIDLDGFFGIPQSAAPLKPIYDDGTLAFIHAAGAPEASFSHFDAEKHIEHGEDGAGTLFRDGWLGRHLKSIAPWGSGQLRGAASTGTLPKTLRGAPATLSIRNFTDGGLFPGNSATQQQRRAIIEQLHEEAPSGLREGAINTLATIDILSNIDFENYVPDNGAVYTGFFGRKLSGTAALIKADVGVETVMANYGGWDFHADQGPIDGGMAELTADLTSNLLAFYQDMQSCLHKITILIMTEFGRRVSENYSFGTDHGKASCMIAIGGGINGGRVITEWPGLGPGEQDRGNLATTIDYRDVLSEILERRLGNTNLDLIFPGYVPVYRGVTN